jgi:uncharacterized protein (TIGR02001 family)
VRRARSARLPLILAALAFAGRAAAQVQGAVAVASDDRFRGRSVSQGWPVATLDLSYDAPNGVYAGVAATGVATEHDGARFLAAQQYIGYAKRLPAGPTVDFGVTHANYTEYYNGFRPAQYSELYAGVILRRFTARLYYSPNYFDRSQQTLYGELNTAVRPARGLRLSAHAGVLTVLDGPHPPGYAATQFDWRLGLATEIKSFEIEVAGSGAGPDRDYYSGKVQSKSGVVVALRRSF